MPINNAIINSLVLAIRESWLWKVSNRYDIGMHRDDSGVAGRETLAAFYSRRSTERSFTKAGAVAVIPISGVIAQRPSMYDWGDEVYTEWIGEQIAAANADSSVAEIVLDIDSPGGTVNGVPELADKMYGNRGSGKRITAVANGMAASAAYWLGSQADKFYVAPSSEVGSIGVYQMHVDRSAMMEAEGVKISFVSAGKYKVEGNPFEPLGDEARADMQAGVDRVYDEFIGSVARGRGVSASVVRKDFGQGRMKGAADAKAAGMVDGVKTLSAVIDGINAKRSTAKRLSAHRAELLSQGIDAR